MTYYMISNHDVNYNLAALPGKVSQHILHKLGFAPRAQRYYRV
jgi:hypothetical protein